VQRAKREAMREELARASPTVAATDATPIISGWLSKQSFNITEGERSKLKTSLSGWKKRWFVLRQDGLMYYYKGEGDQDMVSGAMPVDLRQVTEVTDPSRGGSPTHARESGGAAGGGASGESEGGGGNDGGGGKPLERDGSSGSSSSSSKKKTSFGFTFTFGGRVCGLKAESQKEKEAWIRSMQGCAPPLTQAVSCLVHCDHRGQGKSSDRPRTNPRATAAAAVWRLATAAACM
jgi:hypothetical protein